MTKKKVTKPEHDAGKDLQNKKSSKTVKELSAKILSDKAKINKLESKLKKNPR